MNEISPCILFIDEIDLLIANKENQSLSSGDKKVLTLVLQQVDGETGGGNKGVLIVGATNHIDNVDPAVCRSRRLGEKVYIGLPALNDIKVLFKGYLKDYLLIEPSLSKNFVYQKMEQNEISVASVLEYIKALTDDLETNNLSINIKKNCSLMIT